MKSSLARRATEGTPLAPAFDGSEGSLAVVWGGEDFVSLAKEMVAIHKKPEFEKCTARGGVMDGEKLTAEKVKEVSKWPNRVGQISIAAGADSLARGEAAVAAQRARRQAGSARSRRSRKGEEAAAAA